MRMRSSTNSLTASIAGRAVSLTGCSGSTAGHGKPQEIELPPPGQATAQCFENTDDTLNDRFACFGSRGRYAFSLGSGQRNDAYQQAAAQYALLVDSE